MRPIRLRLEGLRSYRNEVTVEFSDVNLVAVIGDTGAGKSSLLEAITYALYGASTWSGQPGDLISDACSTMRVELEFVVDGRPWIARRSMSRSGYPAPVHHLECVDTNERVDGRNEVNKAVTRLLGLDSGAFLQTVLLPQGRFAELLWATGTERNKVLKNIFRVDELEAIREQAKRLHTELKPRAAMLAHARSMLLPDPKAVEKQAAKRLRAARKRVGEIEHLGATYTAHTAEATQQDTLASGATRVLEMLETFSIDDIPERLAQLVELDRWHGEKIDQSNAELSSADTALHAHRQRLDELAAERSDHSYLAPMRDELIEIRNQLAALHEDLGRIASSRASVAHQDAALIEFQGTAEAARLEAQSATIQHDATAQRAEQTQQALAAGRNALAELRLRTAKRSDSAEAAALAAERRDAAETALTAIVAQLTDIERDLTAARHNLDAATRQHSAAEAAHGAHAGDPCPICARPLPEGFTPPVVEKLTTAKRRAKDAETAERAVRDANADHAAALAVTTSELEAARNALAAATVAYDDQLSLTANAIGDPYTQESLANALDGTDDALVAGLVERDATAHAEREGTASQMSAAAAAAQTADSEYERARGSLQERIERLAIEEQAAHQRLNDVVQLTIAIDERFRPDTTVLSGGNLLLVASNVDVAGPLAKLEAALEHATELAEQERALAQARELVGTAHRELIDAHAKEVTTPARAQLGHLDRAYGVIALALSALSLASVPDLPPDHEDLGACARWSETLKSTAELVETTATASLDAARNAAQNARDSATDLLANADVKSLAELQTLLVDAATEARDCERDVARAKRQGPVAAELDDRLQHADAFLDALACLQAQLADGAFIRNLISRRQRALLGVASTILSEMTNERYGFADDFQIVDRVSGLARAAKTLSGGESFLASLALALAMVEIAGRAGGRLEALFLDEGFGALDANNLDAALDALESRARAGRLIVVISHVLAVAERVPDVLSVRAGTAGATQVLWLSEADRAGAIESEISDALSGLLA